MRYEFVVIVIIIIKDNSGINLCLIQAGWNPTQLTVLDRLQAEAITPEQLAALSQDQRNALLQAEYGDDVNLAEDIVMQTTQQVHVLPTLKGKWSLHAVGCLGWPFQWGVHYCCSGHFKKGTFEKSRNCTCFSQNAVNSRWLIGNTNYQ